MSVEALIRAIEESPVDTNVSAELIAERVAARGEWIAELTTLDASSLTADERDRLRKAIASLHARDALAITTLDSRLSTAAEGLAKIREARGVVRGYRNVAPHRAGCVLSTA